jgi:hypothetical protein
MIPMHLMLPPALGDLLKQRYVLAHVDLHFSMIMLTCYFFVLNKLWTLCTFWLSFGGLGPLFSSFYRLFCKNRGGGVPLTAKILADSALENASAS